jgi:hypothetical protein
MSFVLSSGGKIVHASPSACTFFGCEMTDFEQSVDFRDLFPAPYKVWSCFCAGAHLILVLFIVKALWDHDKTFLLSSVVEVQVESIS